MSASPSTSPQSVSYEAVRALHQRIDEIKEDVREIGKSQGELSNSFSAISTQITGFIHSANKNLDDHEGRIRGLEKARYWIMGAAAAVGYIIHSLLSAK